VYLEVMRYYGLSQLRQQHDTAVGGLAAAKNCVWWEALMSLSVIDITNFNVPSRHVLTDTVGGYH